MKPTHKGSGEATPHPGLQAGEARGADPSTIHVGSHVMLRDLDSGQVESHKLVLERESNPTCGLLSVESPLGQVLLGRREGARVSVAAPHRMRSFEILDVSTLPRHYGSGRSA